MSESQSSVKRPVCMGAVDFRNTKMLLDCFIFSNLIYCPLVWDFSSAALSQKVEKAHERPLRLLYNDSFSIYNSLLSKSEWPTMKVSHLRKLAIEVFKLQNPQILRLYVQIFQERFTLCLEKK